MGENLLGSTFGKDGERSIVAMPVPLTEPRPAIVWLLAKETVTEALDKRNHVGAQQDIVYVKFHWSLVRTDGKGRIERCKRSPAHPYYPNQTTSSTRKDEPMNTTGQSIAMDGVIQRIYAETHTGREG